MIRKLIYGYVRKKKDSLKRRIDARYEGIWLGDTPEILTESDIQVGDVLFCGNAKTNKATELIKNMTDGTYVHCGIYVGNGNVADIVRSGARYISLNCFLNDYSYIAVARCSGIDSDRQNKIIMFAKSCIDQKIKYNYLGAFLLPISEYFYLKNMYGPVFGKKYRELKYSKKRLSTDKMFCSEFIVECFKSCGYIEQYDPYSISHKCSPMWLAEENMLGLIGYLVHHSLSDIDRNDPFLGGCGDILDRA